MRQKLKTKKAIKKRVKVTAHGKILRRKGGKSHLLSGKSTRRKRELRRKTLVAKANQKSIKKMLPYG
ncbi:MAG: 50S ribosomal protein L35 [Candidatus Omnitrophica bacterium]|nr:50S ribosomal protein L35 [Candidatus Omnitrophota bacterium]